MIKLIVRNKVLLLLLFSSTLFYVIIWFLSRSELKSILQSASSIEFIYLYNIASDKSYFEFFQYNLLLWCSLIAFFISLKKSHQNTWFLGILYFYLMIDDLLKVHESIGPAYVETFIVKNINTEFLKDFIRVQDLSELAIWLIVGFVISLTIMVKYKSFEAVEKVYLFYNVILWICLAFFGVIVDVFGANKELYLVAQSNFIVNGIFTFVEEVGEIACIVFLFLFLYNYNEYLSKIVR